MRIMASDINTHFQENSNHPQAILDIFVTKNVRGHNLKILLGSQSGSAGAPAALIPCSQNFKRDDRLPLSYLLKKARLQTSSLRSPEEVDAAVNLLTTEIQAAMKKTSSSKPITTKGFNDYVLANIRQKPGSQQMAQTTRSDHQTPIERSSSNPPQ